MDTFLATYDMDIPVKALLAIIALIIFVAVLAAVIWYNDRKYGEGNW